MDDATPFLCPGLGLLAPRPLLAPLLLALGRLSLLTLLVGGAPGLQVEVGRVLADPGMTSRPGTVYP
ncbi:hypothetical protein AMK21_30505 [Streptomyces sp. CB00316]|nr:hypothetical protein AMK21_30505 [Streptomyces sp. CB00316]